MTDDDIHAFPNVAPPPRPPRRLWPWLLGAAGLFALLAALAIAGVVTAIGDVVGDGINLTINGETVHLGVLHGAHSLAVVFIVIAVALMAVFVVVPLVVALVMAAVAAGVAVVLLAALLVVGIALSPLLAFLALIWWALRPRRTLQSAA